MRFKEFIKWCDERACDGMWGFSTATICADAIRVVMMAPFWKREKVWQKINQEHKIVEEFVEPTNKKIETFLTERRMK